MIAFVIPCMLRLQSIIECAKVSTSVRKSNGGSSHGASETTAVGPWTRFAFPSFALKDIDEDQRKCIRTPYASPWSNDVSMVSVFVIGLGVFFYVLISLVKG